MFPALSEPSMENELDGLLRRPRQAGEGCLMRMRFWMVDRSLARNYTAEIGQMARSPGGMSVITAVGEEKMGDSEDPSDEQRHAGCRY